VRTRDFDYRLPRDRIAQRPLASRDASRLLVLDRASGRVTHRVFRELPELLAPGDLAVVNDARVVPARVRGRRAATGGKVEVLFIEPEIPGRWRALLGSGGRLEPGEIVKLPGDGAHLRLLERQGLEGDLVETGELDVPKLLAEHGHVPLPPYITRPDDDADRAAYQTVYARTEGAVAAPTAGLHFTPELLARLEARGVERAAVTLHVGPGTFRPVKAERVEDHAMHAERFEIGAEAASAVNRARAESRRVVAVGTTVVRALESAARATGRVEPFGGRTSLFIRPPFEFQAVDALVTNFHPPRSTLLMLVAAFAGREHVLAAYAEAVREGYRFFSYGDAMLIR